MRPVRNSSKLLWGCGFSVLLLATAFVTISSAQPEIPSWLSIRYDERGIVVNSTSDFGNYSFEFALDMEGQVKRVAFFNDTGRVWIAYALPVEVVEYVDLNENGTFDYVYPHVVSDASLAVHKLDWAGRISEPMVGVFGGETSVEWTVNGLLLPTEGQIDAEQRLPELTLIFHYLARIGALKMDFALSGWVSQSASSRLFLEMGMGVYRPSASAESPELVINQDTIPWENLTAPAVLDEPRVRFLYDNETVAFFDGSGRVGIDGEPSQGELLARLAPWVPRGYQDHEIGFGVGIQFNYPHVESSLVHDPVFGLGDGSAVPPLETEPPGSIFGSATFVAGLMAATALSAIGMSLVLMARYRRRYRR